MIPLSQGHLKVLDACDRKYQYIFLDALSGPTAYEQQVTAQWGSQFHLLMQQRSLNLPVEVMTPADAEMANSIAALAEAAPEVFEHLPGTSSSSIDSGPAADEPAPGSSAGQTGNQTGSQTFSQSEQRRQLAFGDYLLTVIYDLVVQSPEAGQIFDWKTHQRPPRKEWLMNDWQTRLYLYVLCETTALQPEQLSMTYWFVRPAANVQSGLDPSTSDPSRFSDSATTEQTQFTAETKPSAHRFDYSASQHCQTKQDLQRLTQHLSELRKMAERGVDLPKVSIEEGLCDRCPFNVRCDRIPAKTNGGISNQSPSDNASPDPYQLLRAASQVTIETVEEIPLM